MFSGSTDVKTVLLESTRPYHRYNTRPYYTDIHVSCSYSASLSIASTPDSGIRVYIKNVASCIQA